LPKNIESAIIECINKSEIGTLTKDDETIDRFINLINAYKDFFGGISISKQNN